MIDKVPNNLLPRRLADFIGFDIATLTNFSPEVVPTETIQNTSENYIAVMELNNMFGVSSLRQCIKGEL